MAKYADDSTGKQKFSDARSRSAVLSTIFVLGIMLGIILSESLYIRQQKRSVEGQETEPIRKSLRMPSKGGELDAKQPRNELEKILLKVAPTKEVMVVISNMNLIRETSLELWIQCAKRIKSTNWLIVAIDEELRDYCKENGINHYYRPVEIPATQTNTGDNHAISAMKYEILEEFLTLGWSVLLSDVDIVIVQDPFDHLYRDHDVEGMSDGFNAQTAFGEIYGIDDPSMGWSRYAQGTKHMAMNSGLFYLRSNNRTLSLMRRIAERLRSQRAWDQSVYNEEIFFLSHGEYKSHQVSVRIMEPEIFMNSKTLFKFVRNKPKDQQQRPVMVHVSL